MENQTTSIVRNPAVIIFNPQVWELIDLHQEQKENEEKESNKEFDQ